MILDERNEFADATALDTTGTDTDNIGDIIDLGGTTNYLGGGDHRQMYLVVQITTTVTSGGSATVQFKLVSDATSTIATDGSATEHIASDAKAIAGLTAGTQFAYALPGGAYERYLAFQTVTGTAALTAGAVNAFLTYDPPADWRAYPDAVN